MERLRERDYRTALEVVADVCSQRDLAGYRRAVVSRLADLVPSDVVSFNLAGPSGLLAVDEPAGSCTPALRAVLLPLLKDHPIISHGLARGDARAYRLSDFRSERQFAATALYADFYAKIGLRYELSFTVQCAPGTSLAIGLDRTSRDYSERELALLRLVTPHIVAAHRRLCDLDDLFAGDAAALAHDLTPREREVLAAAASGKTNAEIGRALRISARTAQKHFESIFRKLAVHRRAAAAVVFARGSRSSAEEEFHCGPKRQAGDLKSDETTKSDEATGALRGSPT